MIVLPSLPRDVEIAGRQRAAEDHALRVLADVDEAADADDPVAEAADVDVAFGVDLGEREEREIETAAIVEIELRGLLDHRGEVLPAARVAARDRRAADDALLVGQDSTASSNPSSAAIVDRPVETPAPRLQIAPGKSSIAARRTITLRGPNGSGLMSSTGMRSSPE